MLEPQLWAQLAFHRLRLLGVGKIAYFYRDALY